MQSAVHLADHMLARLTAAAARPGRTPAELVELALQQMFDRQRTPDVLPHVLPHVLPPLPSFNGHGAQVDVTDRDALYLAMDGW